MLIVTVFSNLSATDKFMTIRLVHAAVLIALKQNIASSGRVNSARPEFRNKHPKAEVFHAFYFLDIVRSRSNIFGISDC